MTDWTGVTINNHDGLKVIVPDGDPTPDSDLTLEDAIRQLDAAVKALQDAPAPSGGSALAATDSTSYWAAPTLPADNSGITPVTGWGANDTASPHVSEADGMFTFADAGVYALTLYVEPSADLDASSWVVAELRGSWSPVGAAVTLSPGSPNSPARARAASSFCYYIPVGGTAHVEISTDGLSGTLDVYAELDITRVG